MFKQNGIKNPMVLMQGMGKIKQALKEGGAKFEEHEKEHSFQNGIVVIKTRGDNIISINLSSHSAQAMIKEDVETYEDILAAAINQIRTDLITLRTKFILERAKELNVPPQLMNMLNENNILDALF